MQTKKNSSEDSSWGLQEVIQTVAALASLLATAETLGYEVWLLALALAIAIWITSESK